MNKLLYVKESDFTQKDSNYWSHDYPEIKQIIDDYNIFYLNIVRGIITKEWLFKLIPELKASINSDSKYADWIDWYVFRRNYESVRYEKFIKDKYYSDWNDLSEFEYDRDYKTDLLLEKNGKYLLIQIKCFPVNVDYDLGENIFTTNQLNRMKRLVEKLDIKKVTYLKVHHNCIDKTDTFILMNED